MLEDLSLDFVPPLGLSRGPSFLIDVALLGLAFGALLIGLTAHARRLARAKALERAELESPADLRPGARTVVTGTIDSPGAEPAAVHVTLSEYRGPAGDAWLEGARQIQARPFELDAGGTRVHVDAGPGVFVAAALEPGPELPGGRRESRLELGHGSRVYAYGSLVRERQAFAGYRGGGEGFSLRAPKRGRLVLATASLDSRYDARIRTLLRFVTWATPAWLAFHAWVTLPFVAASFVGTQTSTRVVDIEPAVGSGSSQLLRTETGDGQELETKVRLATAQDLALHEVKMVPLLRVGSWSRASFVGGEAWTSAPAVFGGLFAALIALTTLRQRMRRSTPWYDRR